MAELWHTPIQVVEWDCREQPDFEAIARATSRVFDGTHRPGLTLVPDTGSDQYALVVSSVPMTSDEAQAAYDRECPFCDERMDSLDDLGIVTVNGEQRRAHSECIEGALMASEQRRPER